MSQFDLELDPARLDALYEAMAHWRMFARDAIRVARADQRTLSLDLLHAARHLAAGIDALTQLEQQHERQRSMLNGLRATAATAAERLEARVEQFERLEVAARRTLESGLDSADVRGRAMAAHAAVAAELARLTECGRDAQRAHHDVARQLDRHEERGAELAALRSEFTDLRHEAERGLALMHTAGELLGTADTAYEAAQVSATDLHREFLPRPVGERFEMPVPSAPSPFAVLRAEPPAAVAPTEPAPSFEAELEADPEAEHADPLAAMATTSA